MEKDIARVWQKLDSTLKQMKEDAKTAKDDDLLVTGFFIDVAKGTASQIVAQLALKGLKCQAIDDEDHIFVSVKK